MWDVLPATKKQQLAAKYDLPTLEGFFKSTLMEEEEAKAEEPSEDEE
jgi:hypothetical protein